MLDFPVMADTSSTSMRDSVSIRAVPPLANILRGTCEHLIETHGILDSVMRTGCLPHILFSQAVSKVQHPGLIVHTYDSNLLRFGRHDSIIKLGGESLGRVHLQFKNSTVSILRGHFASFSAKESFAGLTLRADGVKPRRLELVNYKAENSFFDL